MERFAATGVSVAEFCRSEAVSVSNFYVWKKRLEATSDTTSCSAKGGTAAATFLPLVVRATGLPDTVQPTLKLPGSAAIELPSELKRRQRVDLIAAVVEATDATPTNAESV